jgi:hypothetical protein
VFGHLLDSPRTKFAAAATSLSLGLFFTFVWAPHPWTWEGIDQYHDLARAVARGDGFNTTDVPWGYTYYAAFFYAVFGERIWIPIVVQVLLNATLPLLLFAIVRPLAGPRVATLAALLTGLLSFNTIYASTQASDAICSVLFLAAVWCFMRARASDHLAMFALSGVLAGLSTQFRPNLILLPAIVSALQAWPLTRRRLTGAGVFFAASVLVIMPWVIRNYRLAGVFLPTSSHGAVQLWYGTLQVGPYLEDRSANPRSILAHSPFDYTSLIDTPLIVSIDAAACAPAVRDQLALTYWTDRAPAPVSVAAQPAGRALEARIPGQPDGTTVYWTLAANSAPSAYFVSTAHTSDLDRHDDYADAFDVMEVLVRPGARLEDVAPLVYRLIGDEGTATAIEAGAAAVTLRFSDGSWWRVPRDFAGDAAGVEVSGSLAAKGFMTRRPRHAASLPDCLAGRVQVNDVFYRRELHQMQRYGALALNNIRREPWAFAAATAYRSVRLFIVRPPGDASVTYQFTASQVIYTMAMLLSGLYLLAFLASVLLAWRRRSPLLPLAVPIFYVPLTIAMVLTNQRYTVTMQPLMFAFVAFGAVAWLEKRRRD